VFRVAGVWSSISDSISYLFRGKQGHLMSIKGMLKLGVKLGNFALLATALIIAHVYSSHWKGSGSKHFYEKPYMVYILTTQS